MKSFYCVLNLKEMIQYKKNMFIKNNLENFLNEQYFENFLNRFNSILDNRLNNNFI